MACFRQRVPHLAGRTVAQITDRVQRFFRASRRHQDRFLFQIVTDSQDLEDHRRDGFNGSQPARARHAAGKVSNVGLDHPYPASTQYLQVLLSRGVFPHVHVHGGRHDDRGLRREI